GRESGGLLVGEQVGTGVQGSPGTVERVVRVDPVDRRDHGDVRVDVVAFELDQPDPRTG
ncbi:MAG: hypothetical protein JWN06_3816, partial [Propionibacteriaceae bacterium]|nr:hypothetical protein [Propionibacteriaceae bacterium]